MKKYGWFWTVFLIVFIGCGSPPAVHLYMLHLEEITAEKTPAPLKVGIYSLTINPVYANYGIAYQQSPYQIQFYHYHQWASNPASLVNLIIVGYLKQSNQFSSISQLPSTAEVDMAIKGEILRFSEWNESNRWYGWVEIDFQLHQTKNDQLLWQGVISKKVPASQRNPVSVVKALSKATQQIAEELAVKIKGR